MEHGHSIPGPFLDLPLVYPHMNLLPKTGASVLLAVAFLLTCSCGARSGEDSVSVRRIEELIERSLQPGDPAAKIEGFLKENGFTYAFNRFDLRYEARAPGSETKEPNGVPSVIIVDLYLNPDHSFKRSEVRKVYTHL